MIIGYGFGNKWVLFICGEGDVDVMVIDNSWFSLYWEIGLFVVVIVGFVLIVVWVFVLCALMLYVKVCGALLFGYVMVVLLNESGLFDLFLMIVYLLVVVVVCDVDWFWY